MEWRWGRFNAKAVGTAAALAATLYLATDAVWWAANPNSKGHLWWLPTAWVLLALSPFAFAVAWYLPQIPRRRPQLNTDLASLGIVPSTCPRERFDRTHMLMPEARVAPQGWRVLPLLQIRTGASIGPIGLNDSDVIRPPQRALLISALNDAALTTRLQTISRTLSPESALAETLAPYADRVARVAPLVKWDTNPEGRQSLNTANFRIGGDAAAGVSGLAGIRPPAGGTGLVNLTIDIGLSLQIPISLIVAAQIIRDGLVLVTSALPDALREVLPQGAALLRAEVHFLAADNDGQAATRPNELTNRIDLRPFGSPPYVGGQMGFAALLTFPLSEATAAELTAQGLEHMALDMGWTDPTAGIEAVRTALDLSPAHA
jgi:hypothetical protein